MQTQPPLPHLLLPYISNPPPSSLTLITSVLGATSNWLVLRYLYAALQHGGRSRVGEHSISPSTSPPPQAGFHKAVLVSFLRNNDFWRAEAKRLGLDLVRLEEQGLFVFVDGLSRLFHGDVLDASSQPTQVRHASPLQSGIPTSPRTPTAQNRAGPSQTGTFSSAGSTSRRKLQYSGRGVSALDALEKQIVSAIRETGQQRTTDRDQGQNGNGVLLIIDNPDFLLASTGSAHGIGATEMMEWIMELESHAHATILTASADAPLIHNASTAPNPTPLETEHAALVIGLAHRARMVMQLRTLDTGAAKDVSGVLRISSGGQFGLEEDGEDAKKWEEKEVLYHVQRDGGVRVFERGA